MKIALASLVIGLAPSVCHAPAAPAALVFRIQQTAATATRTRNEAGEVTADGTCSKGADCVKVTPAQMKQFLALFRVAVGAPHSAKGAYSPEYPPRIITATYAGGTCEAHDSWTEPVEPAHMDEFDPAFRAIREAILAAHAKKP